MFDVLGWIGAALILAAYFQASRNVWPAHRSLNASVNLVGAALLDSNALHRGAFPNFGLEIIFCLIAIRVIYLDKK